MPRFSEEILLRIGEKFREIRISRGLSTTIAQEIRSRYQVKIDASYLSRMERGKVEIPLRTLFALADFYDINPGQLLDPEWLNSSRRSLNYLLEDDEIISQMERLSKRLGEKRALHHLKIFLNQANMLLDDRRPDDKRIRTTRPDRT